MHEAWDRLNAELANAIFQVTLKGKPGVTVSIEQQEGDLVIRKRCVHCGGLLDGAVLDLGHQGSATLEICPCGRASNFLKLS